jgi:hypothetical protein
VRRPLIFLHETPSASSSTAGATSGIVLLSDRLGRPGEPLPAFRLCEQRCGTGDDSRSLSEVGFVARFPQRVARAAVAAPSSMAVHARSEANRRATSSRLVDERGCCWRRDFRVVQVGGSLGAFHEILAALRPQARDMLTDSFLRSRERTTRRPPHLGAY